MDDHWYCYRCDAPKTRRDLREVDDHEPCAYACRQCGAVEGVWLQPLLPARPRPERA